VPSGIITHYLNPNKNSLSLNMCGITGFYSIPQKFSEEDLHIMSNAISHRGPDASGYFLNEDQTVGLGHRRLSIIDLSAAANQPMTSHNGRYVMVFNGEVYNFKEIARQLDIVPHTSSDSEIILEAFVLKGPSCVHLLNGMFAIAIYDKHEKVALSATGQSGREAAICF
jgi:asparagine synthase (glutamine-hydrolysing)